MSNWPTNTLYIAPANSLRDPDHRSLAGSENAFDTGDDAAAAAEEMDLTCPLDGDEWVVCYKPAHWPSGVLIAGDAIEAFEDERQGSV